MRRQIVPRSYSERVDGPWLNPSEEVKTPRRRPGRALVFAGGLMLSSLVGGVVGYNAREDVPAATEQVPDTTPTTIDSYDKLWARNTELAQAELNSRLVSDEKCIPFFVGSVFIAKEGQTEGVIQNPIIFSDSDVFFPAKSHRYGNQTGAENYTYEPYVVMKNQASASHEAAFGVYLMDDKNYGFKFFNTQGESVETTGTMLPNSQSEFMSNIACTTEIEVRRNPSDQTYFMDMPDGTMIARYVSK